MSSLCRGSAQYGTAWPCQRSCTTIARMHSPIPSCLMSVQSFKRSKCGCPSAHNMAAKRRRHWSTQRRRSSSIRAEGIKTCMRKQKQLYDPARNVALRKSQACKRVSTSPDITQHTARHGQARHGSRSRASTHGYESEKTRRALTGSGCKLTGAGSTVR